VLFTSLHSRLQANFCVSIGPIASTTKTKKAKREEATPSRVGTEQRDTKKILPQMDPDASSNKVLPTYKDQVRGDRPATAAGPCGGGGIDGGINNVTDGNGTPPSAREEAGQQRVVQVNDRPTQLVSELTTSASGLFTDDHHMIHQEPPMIIVQAVEVLARYHDGEDSDVAARASPHTGTTTPQSREAPGGSGGAIHNSNSSIPKQTCCGAYYSWQSMTFFVFGCVFIVGGLMFGCVAQGYCKKSTPATTPATTPTASAIPAVVAESPAPTPLQTLSPVWGTVWNDGNLTDRLNRTQDVDVLLRWEHSVSGTNNQTFDETARNDLEAVVSTTIDAYIENNRNTSFWPFDLTRVSVKTLSVRVWATRLLETEHVVEVSYRSIPIQDMADYVRGALAGDESLLRRLQNTNERFTAVRSLDVAVDGIRITENAPAPDPIQLSGAAFHHHRWVGGMVPATCLYAVTLGALLQAVV
jgi:hypothetical protein